MELVDGSEDEFDALIKDEAPPREKTGRRAATKVNSQKLPNFFNFHYFLTRKSTCHS